MYVLCVIVWVTVGYDRRRSGVIVWVTVGYDRRRSGVIVWVTVGYDRRRSGVSNAYYCMGYCRI